MKANTMMIETVAVIMALLSLLFTSCTIKVDKEEDGEKTTKQMELKDFNKIQIAGAAELVFIQDSIYKVEVTTTEKGFEKLNLNVKDSTLYMDYKNNGKLFTGNNKSYKLTITAPDLQGIQVSGACEFYAEKIKTTEFAAHVSGAGEFDIKNLTAEKVDFTTSGAGDIDAHLVDCGDVEVNVSGAGDIKLSGKARSFSEHHSGIADINTKGLKIEE